MELYLDSRSIDSYRLFLRIKKLPSYSIRGRVASFPDEYAELVCGSCVSSTDCDYVPSPFLFDYQRDISRIAVEVDATDSLYVTEDCIVTHNSQAIRTHSHELQFSGLEKDQARTRGALADYLIKFRAPGENAVPIENHVSRNEWIEWAESCWSWRQIRETDTLNTKVAKSESDTRHICPLQLGVINRLVRLYSNPGDIVLSPFAGIGSEGYESIKLGRRFYGIELKDEYYNCACDNLESAEIEVSGSKQMLLF